MSAATRDQIAGWLKCLYESAEHSHMVVFCDTFDWTDHPTYVPAGVGPRDFIDEYREKYGNGYTVMEVYSRNHGFDEQMAERRAVHYD